MSDAKSSASGIAAWPGPPASVSSALCCGLELATARVTASAICPWMAPLRSRGTFSVPHSKPACDGHGLNARVSARAPPADASSAAQLRTGKSRRRARMQELKVASRSMSHHRQPVTAVGAPAAIGPYSHAVSAAGLLFCSGQIPLDPDSGELVGSTPAEQAVRCLENLQAVCAAAGTSLGDALRLTVYMTDLGAFADVNEVYAGFFEAEPPARVAIGVAALPKGAQVEIDDIIHLPD